MFFSIDNAIQKNASRFPPLPTTYILGPCITEMSKITWKVMLELSCRNLGLMQKLDLHSNFGIFLPTFVKVLQ